MNFFENLVGAVQVGGALVLSPILRSWYNHWGASSAEVNQPLLGDELVGDPKSNVCWSSFRWLPLLHSNFPLLC
jgi:hypothetical protein